MGSAGIAYSPPESAKLKLQEWVVDGDDPVWDPDLDRPGTTRRWTKRFAVVAVIEYARWRGEARSTHLFSLRSPCCIRSQGVAAPVAVNSPPVVVLLLCPSCGLGGDV